MAIKVIRDGVFDVDGRKIKIKIKQGTRNKRSHSASLKKEGET